MFLFVTEYSRAVGHGGSSCGDRDVGGTRNVRSTSARCRVHRHSSSEFFFFCSTSARCRICRDCSRSVRGASACGGVHRARSSCVRGITACGGVHRARSSCVRGISASGEYIAPAPAVYAAQAPVVEYTAPAPAVYAAQAPHCASTGILLEVFNSPTVYVAIQTLLSLYGSRERSAVCTRVDAVSVMSLSGPSFFGGGVATTSGQQHHLPCRCTV